MNYLEKLIFTFHYKSQTKINVSQDTINYYNSFNQYDVPVLLVPNNGKMQTKSN